MLTVDFDRLAVKEGQIALDAGCGYGRHSTEFISRGARVVSMDLDMESLRRTRFSIEETKKVNRKASMAGYLTPVGDALNLPFKENTFDRIICSEVMEHVNDDFKACSELARVLKKDGLIAITVPTFFSEQIYDVLTHEYYTSPGGMSEGTCQRSLQI